MFTSGAPKKLIQERTAHKRLDALRVYEHTSNVQEMEVSSVVATGQFYGRVSPYMPGSSFEKQMSYSFLVTHTTYHN